MLTDAEESQLRDLLTRVKTNTFVGTPLRGGLPLIPQRTALPTASADYQGLIIYIPGASGVADGAYICEKAAAGTYSWVPMDTPTPTSLARQEFLLPSLPWHYTVANSIPGANTAFFAPVQPLTADVTVTQLIGSIGVQNGNVDVGIYSFDGSTMTKVVSLGSTACPAAATRVAYNIADTALTKGTRYYFAIAADNGTATVAFSSGSAVLAPTNIGYFKASSFPLPSTAASLTEVGSIPILYGSVSGSVAL